MQAHLLIACVDITKFQNIFIFFIVIVSQNYESETLSTYVWYIHACKSVL